jgi:predicted aspartyl protease
MKLTLVASAFAAVALVSAAAAQTPSIDDAIRYSDVTALEAHASGPALEATLARGVLAALRDQNEAAIEALTAAGGDLRINRTLRRDAWIALAGVYGRQGAYADAFRTMLFAETAAAARDEEATLSAAQSLTFARVIQNEERMRRAGPQQGQVALEYDMASLPRAHVAINGHEQVAVLDTGANFSTVTESTARRLRLRMLPGEISVGASGNDDVAGRIGIAELVQVDRTQFRNVVFIVLPDSALSFMDGRYAIPAIIGFPVLSLLGRVEFSGDQLRFSQSTASGWSESSNLLLRDFDPIVRVDGNGHPLRMFLDSGAGRTNLTPLATRDYATLLEGAGSRDVRVGGAGGSRTYEDAATIPRLSIQVAAQTVNLEDVHVVGDLDDGHHGTIGQDVLRAGGGYVIDFDAMRFDLLP